MSEPSIRDRMISVNQPFFVMADGERIEFPGAIEKIIDKALAEALRTHYLVPRDELDLLTTSWSKRDE